MESFFSRYRNEWVLLAILFVQVIALATQVRVPKSGAQPGERSTRLIRVWASGLMYPFQKALVGTGSGIRGVWANYVDLRRVRGENEELRRQLEQERLSKVQILQDAEQGRRLQALLDFQHQFIHKTTAAQVIGTSGTDLARVIYIDRGARGGVKAGQPVITSDGVVGKVSRADPFSAQVLLISDMQSGAGVLLERLRLNGILKGSPSGKPEMLNVMADEKIEVGDRIITTGGDRVYPKGLLIGTVESFSKDAERDPFLTVKVKPAVNLGKLEEVLVITELGESAIQSAANAKPTRVADLLADRLPSVKKKLDEEPKKKEATVVARRAVSTSATAKPATAGPGTSIAPEQKRTADTPQLSAPPAQAPSAPADTASTPPATPPQQNPPAQDPPR